MKNIKRFSIVCLLIFSFVAVACHRIENVDTLKIVHLDCGRKYFSVSSIKKLIDISTKGDVTHIELAFGNDGLRFLLDDMSIQQYASEQVKEGLHLGNEQYADFEVDELTQNEMDEILDYAHEKGIEIIPLLNSPGHMDSILSCLEYCGIKDVRYHNSKRTIDLHNEKAVLFVQTLLQKYMDYFSDKECTYFSIGADEYANDVYTTGNKGFGELIRNNEYNLFINYVNTCAKEVKQRKMIPMAFNDGIYFDNCREFGQFDTDLLICFWSSGDWFYHPCSCKKLQEYGFDLVNTNSSYYWVLENESWQCSESKMKRFDFYHFSGGYIEESKGSMFCIWCDDPKADLDIHVIERVKNLIWIYGNGNGN